MALETDIAVIGGGPAGLTAAIVGRMAGMRLVVLERRQTLVVSAGESMHPGLAPLIGQLGLLKEFEQSSTGRFPGILIRKGSQPEYFEPFGETDGVQWLGYHVPRYDLARLLYNRASALDCEFKFGHKASGFGSVTAGRNISVESPSQTVRAKWVLDATGSCGFSVRRDKTGYHRATPPRITAYSYHKEKLPNDWRACTPVLQIEPWGWEWKAPLGNGKVSCVSVYNDASAKLEQRHRHIGKIRYADGTWVVAKEPSCKRVFRIGDAALRFDPSSGKGVLRSMMTAMMAVHLISKVRQESVAESDATSYYNAWIHRWFRYDAEMLSRSSLL